MEKVNLAQIKRKTGWSGKRYGSLIGRIIGANTNNVNTRLARANEDIWNKGFRKIGYDKKRFIMPSLQDVIPSQYLTTLKSAEKGRLITKTLHGAISRNLNDALNTFTDKTGEQRYLTRRGKGAGKINSKLIYEMEKSLKGTFEGYTRKHRDFGMPRNVHDIAVTEVRSAVGMMKKAYVDKMLEKNPDVEMMKAWVHNSNLSEKSRKGHTQMDGVTLQYGEKFRVPLYREFKGKNILVGYTDMDRPHDPSAPPEQVICCNCDLQYVARKKTA